MTGLGSGVRLLAITPPAALAPDIDPGLVDAWLEAGTGEIGLAVLLREPGGRPDQILAQQRLFPLRRVLAESGIPAFLSVDPCIVDDPDATQRGWIRDAEPALAGVQLRGDPSAEQCASWRAWLGPDATIGRSVHGRALTRAAPDVDYSVLAPIFAPNTVSPGDDKRPIGLEGMRQWTAIPGRVLALGGISPINAEACLEAGAHGVAGIRLFFGRIARTQDNVGALCRVFARRAARARD